MGVRATEEDPHNQIVVESAAPDSHGIGAYGDEPVIVEVSGDGELRVASEAEVTDGSADGQPRRAVLGVPELHDAAGVRRQDAEAVRQHEHIRHGASMFLRQARSTTTRYTHGDGDSNVISSCHIYAGCFFAVILRNACYCDTTF